MSPDLGDSSVTNSRAVFLVDTSLSSRPEKFNVWLDLLKATLQNNRKDLKQFAVLFFDARANPPSSSIETDRRRRHRVPLSGAAYQNNLSVAAANDFLRGDGHDREASVRDLSKFFFCHVFTHKLKHLMVTNMI